MAFPTDDLPRKKPVHEIGQDLSLLSVDDLNERIVVLQAEIDRLVADSAKKAASRSAADAVFKR